MCICKHTYVTVCIDRCVLHLEHFSNEDQEIELLQAKWSSLDDDA